MNTENVWYKRSGIVSWAIFLATLVVVLITLTTAIFPALVLRTMGGVEDYSAINPFEIGIWAYPLLITNFIILGIVILYFKNKIPQPVIKSVRFILNFEVSANVASLVIIILLGLYVVFTVPELSTKEPWPDYYRGVKPMLEKWTINDITKGFDLHVRYFLITTSMNVFSNYKVIPFIASLALLVLTYLITTEISKKRLAGTVSVVIVLQSGTFLTYDTSITYDNFWTLFYLLSLYIIYKKWPLSPISFILSLFSKQLTAIFLPMTLFFVYRTSISKQKKILLTITYGIVIIIGIIAVIGGKFGIGTTAFESHDFWMAFNAISYQLRYDGLVLAFLLPLTVGLFALRKKVAHADSIMVLIMGMLLSQPVTAAFTNQLSEPYRFMPLIVFFAIGVGIILSKKVKPT